MYAVVLLGMFLISLPIYVFARIFPSFADFMNGTLCHAMRRALAFITDIFSFSLAEMIIIASPILVFFIIFRALRVKDGEGRIRFVSGLVSIALVFLSSYWFMLGIGYHTTSLSERAKMEEASVDAESLAHTLSVLTEECNKLAEELSLDENGASVMPITFDEACSYITEAYARLSESMPELDIPVFDSRAKQVLLSKPMSALEITGVYTFFTGEANVNVYYPDYNLPFTIAHELAHQRGVARENEANFVAFLVCKEAEHPYVRYSGYMNMLEYVASALRKTDLEVYRSVFDTFHPSLVSELRAYSEFYKNNKKQFWSKVSDTVNDTYLKVQGTEGIVSYGLVVRLCVAYYSKSAE